MKKKGTPRINYISLVNAFWKRLLYYPLKQSSITVWFYFVHKDNSWDWIEWFSVNHEDSINMIGISKNTFYSCRDELESNGFIKVKKSNNRALNDKISIIVLYQILGTELGTDDGTGEQPELGTDDGTGEQPELGTDDGTQRESSGNLDKPLKPQTLNEKTESVKGSAPSQNLIFEFLLKNTVELRWTEGFCRKKAPIFHELIINDWGKIERYGWEKKLSIWVKNENDPETTNNRRLKLSDGRTVKLWYDRKVIEGITINADRTMFFTALKEAGWTTYLNEKKNTIWVEPGGYNPILQDNNPKSLIPEPIYKDAMINSKIGIGK